MLLGGCRGRRGCAPRTLSDTRVHSRTEHPEEGHEMIQTLEGTEQRLGSVSIRMVEVSETKFVHGIARDFLVETGWEMTCDACDEICTMLTQREAEAQLHEHACPDVPPCETVE